MGPGAKETHQIPVLFFDLLKSVDLLSLSFLMDDKKNHQRIIVRLKFDQVLKVLSTGSGTQKVLEM